MSSEDDDLAAVSLAQLAEPRPLTAPEQTLIDALVEPLGVAELTALAACVKVTAECACGCPSIGLYSSDELSPEAIAQLAAVAGIGHAAVEITAYSVNERGDDVQITLHVVGGSIAELEIWTGTFGSDVRTELPAPGSLRPAPYGSSAG